MKITCKTNAVTGRQTPVVRVNPMRLVMLLLSQVKSAVETALYSASAIPHVRGDDLQEILNESFL